MTLSESASSSTQAINHHEYSDCLSSVYSSTSLTNPNSLPTAPMLENDHWEHSRLRHSWKHFPALSLNHDPINNHFINNDVWSSFSKHLLDSFDNKTVENPSIPFNQDHFLKVASNLEGGTRDHAALVAYPGLESFKLLEKLGEGAFSQVYHAFDLEHKKDVAIKVIDKAHMSPYQRLAVQNEISIHSKLKHPNIISLNRHFETPSNYFLVMEWMPGGEIFQKIVELTFFSEDLSRHVIIQVAKGIHYLHHVVGVVHRDIKPENILFHPIPTGESKIILSGRTYHEEKKFEDPYTPIVGGGGIGTVKIADFGLSKVVWRDETQTPCGTVGYTAPEIVKSQKYTTSVDLWALGCVLYTLLCGFPPFYDDDNKKLSEKVAKGEWSFLEPWWNNVSSSAKDLVSKLLEVCPDKRYTINDFFSHPWVLHGGSNLLDFPNTLPPPSPLPLKFDWKSFVLPPLRTPEAGAYPQSPTPSQKQLKWYFDTSYKVFHDMHDRATLKPEFKDFEKKQNFKLNLAEASILKNRKCRKSLN